MENGDENERKEQLDQRMFQVGWVGHPNDPDVMIVHIPIKFYVESGAEGMDMMWGKIRRVEAIASTVFKQMTQKRRESGVIKSVIGADGRPITVS